MSWNKQIQCVVRLLEQVRAGGADFTVLTPAFVLRNAGFDAELMEQLRNGVDLKRQKEMKLFRALEAYRGWWEWNMEQLLLQQYKHPLLASYPKYSKYDFGLVHRLLMTSRKYGILNFYSHGDAKKQTMLPVDAFLLEQGGGHEF